MHAVAICCAAILPAVAGYVVAPCSPRLARPERVQLALAPRRELLARAVRVAHLLPPARVVVLELAPVLLVLYYYRRIPRPRRPDEHAALFPLKGAGRDARDALRRLAELQFEPAESVV